MKKILVIANYYYPDIASLGQLITDICNGLNNEFEFEVIAAIPNYSKDIEINTEHRGRPFYTETINGVRVHRIIVPNVNKKNKLSRIKYIIKYYLNSKKAIRDINDYNIVLTVSQPPILGGMLGYYAKKSKKESKLIYNIQDFNPEQVEAVKFTKYKFLIYLLRYLDNRTLKIADKILLVGHDQIDTLRKRNQAFVQKSLVINNWSDDQKIVPMNEDDMHIKEFKEKYGLRNKFIIMYSGNIGLFYDLENLIEVTNQFKNNEEIEFVFIGEGAVKQKLEDYIKNNNIENVKFITYQPKDQLNVSLNSADVHLVVNAKGIKGVSVPSKIYGVMAAGKPVIGVLEEGSEARNIIMASGCGECIEPNNYAGFAELIQKFYENREHLRDVGYKGRKYLDDNINKSKSIDKYRLLFREI